MNKIKINCGFCSVLLYVSKVSVRIQNECFCYCCSVEATRLSLVDHSGQPSPKIENEQNSTVTISFTLLKFTSASCCPDQFDRPIHTRLFIIVAVAVGLAKFIEGERWKPPTEEHCNLAFGCPSPKTPQMNGCLFHTHILCVFRFDAGCRSESKICVAQMITVRIRLGRNEVQCIWPGWLLAAAQVQFGRPQPLWLPLFMDETNRRWMPSRIDIIIRAHQMSCAHLTHLIMRQFLHERLSQTISFTDAKGNGRGFLRRGTSICISFATTYQSGLDGLITYSTNVVESNGIVRNAHKQKEKEKNKHFQIGACAILRVVTHEWRRYKAMLSILSMLHIDGCVSINNTASRSPIETSENTQYKMYEQQKNKM